MGGYVELQEYCRSWASRRRRDLELRNGLSALVGLWDLGALSALQDESLGLGARLSFDWRFKVDHFGSLAHRFSRRPKSETPFSFNVTSTP